MAYHAQSAHIGSSFSIVELLYVLYSYYPDDEIILSKGHGAMALYAILNELGHIQDSDIRDYFSNGSTLHGLIPGMGSLGHGLPVATGRAYALKRENHAKRVFCILGDGELQEGSNWEAIQFAAHHRLSNLTVVVDRNRFQAMGKTGEILDAISIREKFQAFGFMAHSCFGHNIEDLKTYLVDLVNYGMRPTCLVAETTKGKGVSFMENNNDWHYKRLCEEDYHASMREIAKDTVGSHCAVGT